MDNQDEKQFSENQNVRNFYKQLEVDNKNLKKRVENLKLQIEFYMYSEQLEAVVAELQNKKAKETLNIESKTVDVEKEEDTNVKEQVEEGKVISMGKKTAKK